MEFMIIKEKNRENISSKKKKFKIRRRKSFLDENGENTFKIWKKKELLNKNSLTLNRSQSQKQNVQNKKKNSFFCSVLNYKNIEDEIRHVIKEMRRACLWELRRQSYELKMLDINDKEFENEKDNNLSGKLSSKYLFNNSLNDKSFEKYAKKKQKSKTIILKKNDLINELYLNDKKNELDINNFRSKLDISKTNIDKNNKKNNKIIAGDKFRFLYRGGLVLDSNDENESDEDHEQIGYLINPESTIIYIYDLLICFGVFYSLLYIPYELAKYFCPCNFQYNLINKGINIIIDLLFIIDLVINFFHKYYEKEEKIIFHFNIKIIYKYIFGWFFIDLLSSVPINIILFFNCRNYQTLIYHTYEKGSIIDILFFLRCFKAIKIFKILSRKKNQLMTKIIEKCTDNILLGNIFEILNDILFVFIGLHIISCSYIFIGKHTFPGWIHKNELQNSSFWNLYMISIYYIITTLTTVGYGDISPDSLIEIIFRVILLAFGIVGYSWLISSISNGINKENFASINFANECQILEEIRMTYKKLPYKLYSNIINHLKHKHFYQKKYDKHLLFNSLPYSLKNNLIVSMYNYQLEKFHFFKNISNSNFLVDILTCFSPISALKGDILLRENDLIEEMYFVKEGKLSLEVSINIANPEESINKYLSDDFLNFAFDFDPNLNYSQIQKYSKINTINTISTFMGRKQSNLHNSTTSKKEVKNTTKNVYLKIHDIHKNEDFGDIFMFFGKRSPFALRVKTKRALLFGVKKEDFTKLCEQYKNIFREIHKKKKHNLNIIKNIMIKTIMTFCNVKGIKINNRYKNTIQKAINELNKEIIPIDILKNQKLESAFNEIDDEINQTIEDFDKELSHLNSELNIKEKIKKIYRKSKSSNVKKCKKFLLEESNSSNEYESIYYSSVHKNRKKKKHKQNNNKTIMKSNIRLNSKLGKKIDFNFSESDDSEKTEELKTELKETSEIGPNTLQILPQSLIDLIKSKIKDKNSFKKDDKDKEENIFICINNNYNYESNIKNINTNNIGNNMDNIKKYKKSSSNVTFKKILNNINGEQNLKLKNKKENKIHKKSNFTSVSLFHLKEIIFL